MGEQGFGGSGGWGGSLVGRIEQFRDRKGAKVKIKIGARTMARVHARALWLRDERGAAETSTILAWIVVGVLVVFALRAGLTSAGNDVIEWVTDQVTNVTVDPVTPNT